MPRINPLISRFRVERARELARQVYKYKLGKGGFGTERYDEQGRRLCDCSGFVSEVLMTRRAPKKGRPFWIETSAIWHDATGAQLVFTRLSSPEPGCLVVYPDRKVLGIGRQGHIGVVTVVESFGIIGIDCSAGMSKKGNAVAERTFGFFTKEPRHIFCCLKQDLL